MKTFMLLVWLCCLSLAPLQAATDAANRENFRAAIELAKMADEAITVYTQKSPPTEEDLATVLAAVKAVKEVTIADTSFLHKLHSGLPAAFGELRAGYFLLSRGFEKRDNNSIKPGAGMVLEWGKFWSANRREIALALASNESDEKAQLFNAEINRAAVERWMLHNTISQLLTLAAKQEELFWQPRSVCGSSE